MMLTVSALAAQADEPLFGTSGVMHDRFTLFFHRHGLDYEASDFAIELQVAARQEAPIGRIAEVCMQRFLIQQLSQPQILSCLEEQEEVERRLGNLN